MDHKRSAVFGLLAAAVLLLAGCMPEYDWYAIDCSGFRLNITSGEAVHDNTDEGRQIVSVQAFDGMGNLIYENREIFNTPVGSPIPPGILAFNWHAAPQGNPIRVSFFVPAGGTVISDYPLETFTGVCADHSGVPGVFDGRINRHHIAAPVAIYPVDYGNGTGLHLYRIDETGKGTLALTVSAEAIAAVPEQPAENTLIASTPDGSIALYRLTTGEYQVNAGEYVVIFAELHALTDYYMP
ncbi:MAG: hypothetical protein JXN59_11345 [Anaerolineae bacterium]|nr:hypothetical protein [Anaerolineae bacterium]